MFIKTSQQLKHARIIYFTLSCLLETTFEVHAKSSENIDDYQKNLKIHQSIKTKKSSKIKIAIIDGYFNPKSGNLQGSLSTSTKRTYEKKNSEIIGFQSAAKELGGHHANHVSSIIHEINPKAKLRVIDLNHEPSLENTSEHSSRLTAAIDAAIESKVEFINISQRISPNGDWNGKISKDLKKAFYRARDAGIGIIKSAGNDNEFIGETPYTKSLAKLLDNMKGNMIIVTALQKDSEILANFSNKAGIAYQYTVSAPGESIVAYGASYQLVEMSGTSMAAPIVTATASLLRKAHPELTARDILDSIRHSARKVSLDKKIYFEPNTYGCGILDWGQTLGELKRISNKN